MSVPVCGGAAAVAGDRCNLGGLLGGIGGMTLSPDGKRFAFVGAVQEPVRSYSQPDLWVLDLQPERNPKT